MTIEHDAIPAGEIHEPKGISTALSGQAYLADGLGGGVWTALFSTSQIIPIAAEADFPTQDATTITLETQRLYLTTAAFTTTKNFIVEDGAVLSSISTLGPLVTYTGTNPMFSGTDVDFVIRDIRITHPNAEGYDFTDTVGGQKVFLSDRVRHLAGTKYGTFNDMQTVLITVGAAFDMDDGISFTGTNSLINSIDKLFIGSTSASFKAIDLGTSISQTTEFRDVTSNAPVGAFGISGLASSGNVPTTRLAMINNCEFGGGMTALENITTEDIRFKFRDNTPIPDTIEDAMVSLSDNATATVIPAIDTPAKIAGTWVCERESLFSCDTTGRITVTSERDIVVPIDATLSIDVASGANKDLKAYIALNGTVIANSSKSVRVSSGAPQSLTLLWQLSLATTDYLEVFVENTTDAVNIIAVDAILRAR